MVATESTLRLTQYRRPLLLVKSLLGGNASMRVGVSIVLLMLFLAIFGGYLAPHPFAIDPIHRLLAPSWSHPFGTDALGRSVLQRTIYGSRVSLEIGCSVAVLSTVFGLAIGLVATYFRWLDGIIMRFMDGLMAIPGILLAIAFMAIASASLTNVIVALTIPQVPRMVRLVRSVILSVREQSYIEAAISIGTKNFKLLTRHLLPNAMAPVLVQTTFICASAMINEAILSFLGAGTPPNIPSWGNIMAEGREYFQIAPWIIMFPGIMLSITVLAVNLLGDGMRDRLDPRMRRLR